MPKTVYAADLFCGAGGTSNGIYDACDQLGLNLNLLAINHWPLAVATHQANHPEARHLCETLDSVDPRKVIPGGRLNLLCASPECTHHSNARGGMPMSDQSRASAWHVLRWAEALRIDNIMVENVREFINWGPIGANGRPLKSRKGETFKAWLNALESLGYNFEWNVVNCANYGDATSRQRFFLLAKKGRKKVNWPDPTHGEDAPKPWRAAREIIDWSIPGESIFTRKRPLADKTIKRIAAGLEKFGGDLAEPFLVMLYGTGTARSVDRPMPTVTANGQHIALCQPFLIPQFSSAKPRSVDRPLSTITTTSRGIRLVLPFIMSMEHGGRTFDPNKPMPTITTADGFAVVNPYLVCVNHGDKGKSDAMHRTKSIDEPMPTLSTKNGWGLASPFLIKFYGTGKTASVHDPLDTVTTKDRFGLVTPGAVEGKEPQTYALDIRFRMLQPHELAAAMSFPKDYTFAGNRGETVKQIGNAVPRRTAKRLAMSLLAA